MAAKTASKGTKKAPAKKTTAPAKSKPAAKKGPAPKTTKAATKTPAKKTTAAKGKGKQVKNVPAPAKAEPTYRRIMSETTGFSVGTDQDIIAEALLAGGESREDIIAELSGQLDSETRNGSPKPISSLVSSVLRKMLERGFTVDQHFILVPPAPKAAKGKKRAA